MSDTKMQGKPVGAPASGRRAPRVVAGGEIEEILERNWWGVLSMTLEECPYAVPVVYGYDGSAFYIATGPGRKLETLLANPAACLTITELEEAGALWRSVVVTGTASPVEGLGERLAAFNALRRQRWGATESPQRAMQGRSRRPRC